MSLSRYRGNVHIRFPHKIILREEEEGGKRRKKEGKRRKEVGLMNNEDGGRRRKEELKNEIREMKMENQPKPGYKCITPHTQDLKM